MKHRMHENSLKTYEEILESLPKRRGQVFTAIKDIGIATLEQICLHINSLPHKISGRIGELKENGLIVHCGNTINSEGYPVSQYKIAENIYVQKEQAQLF